jgi:hypothetical protein
MARRAGELVLQVAIDATERAVIDEIRRAGGLDSDANAVRTALWSLADHMQLDVPNGAFDLRHPSGNHRPKNPNPKIRQESGTAA